MTVEAAQKAINEKFAKKLAHCEIMILYNIVENVAESMQANAEKKLMKALRKLLENE